MSKTDYEKEVSRHNLGTICLWGGIGLLLLVCFAMHGGSGAGILGMIGIFAILVGFFLHVFNRSAAKIEESQALAKAQVDYLAAKIKSGQPITEKDTDDISGLTKAREDQQKKKDTGRIIKGAVTGGIIAGEAGAVVGAVVAKNKIDNEKK